MSGAAAILIATRNRGKLREVTEMLRGFDLILETLDDHPNLLEPVEDGATFEENATRKARHYARLTGRWTLADDSGLEVDALGGEPGVHSARYAGPACDAAANNAKLIGKLAGVPHRGRTARFRCVVALAGGGRVAATASGVVEGVIIDDPRGSNGFGYDPHFYLPEHEMTTAEMNLEQKNRISHRGRALAAICPQIQRLVRDVGPG